MAGVKRDKMHRALLQGDREDLLEVLTLRFGPVPTPIQVRIAACEDAAALERWILVAANVPDWAAFRSDFEAGSQPFKVVGPRYEPAPAAPHPPREPHTGPGAGAANDERPREE